MLEVQVAAPSPQAKQVLLVKWNPTLHYKIVNPLHDKALAGQAAQVPLIGLNPGLHKVAYEAL